MLLNKINCPVVAPVEIIAAPMVNEPTTILKDNRLA